MGKEHFLRDDHYLVEIGFTRVIFILRIEEFSTDQHQARF